jgi:RNA polymerase sigma factor (sigma-70 family)
VRASDPLANPEPLIRKTYAYVAYRIGAGHDAEDVTSTAIERALRYRASYDRRKGDPLSWLIGIARTCVNDHLRDRVSSSALQDDVAGHENVEAEVATRLGVIKAVSALDDRERELVALRYGADLTAKEIARVLGMRTNAVEVALHRCRDRLRNELEREGQGPTVRPSVRPMPVPAAESR